MDVTRGIHPDTLAALGGVFHPINMIYLDWPSGPVRAHSGVGTINWGGHDWLGVGNFGAVSVPSEGMSPVVNGAELSLYGPMEMLEAQAGVAQRNRAGEIYVACVTKRAGNQIIGAPIEIYSGATDSVVMRIESEDGGSAFRLVVTLRGGPSDRDAAAAFHSHEDQIRTYPADTGFKMFRLAQFHAKTRTWPQQ